MDKQTTLEEFEKGMTENLSYLQRKASTFGRKAMSAIPNVLSLALGR